LASAILLWDIGYKPINSATLAFAQIITLQQGFPYNPLNGDLLLDVITPACVFTSVADAVAINPVMARAFTTGTDGGKLVADGLTLASGSGTQGIVTRLVCGEPPPEPPSGPIVIIPTMGQWGMIIALIILGFFAVIALRRRTES